VSSGGKDFSSGCGSRTLPKEAAAAKEFVPDSRPGGPPLSLLFLVLLAVAAAGAGPAVANYALANRAAGDPKGQGPGRDAVITG